MNSPCCAKIALILIFTQLLVVDDLTLTCPSVFSHFFDFDKLVSLVPSVTLWFQFIYFILLYFCAPKALP